MFVGLVVPVQEKFFVQCPVQNMFFLTAHYYNSFVPLSPSKLSIELRKIQIEHSALNTEFKFK
jgi:hypothetical protein